MRGTLELVSVANALAGAGPALLQSTRRWLGRDLFHTKTSSSPTAEKRAFLAAAFTPSSI